MKPSGVLVIDKPKGPTSFDVVRDVRRALGVEKAGHTGTLDPMATGVLPLCLGEATKVAQYIIEQSKAYEATLKLGEETDTLDAEGEVVRRAEVPAFDTQAVEAALAKFRGPLMQTPPMYSAVKVKGQRLYELARAGKTAEVTPRPVTVEELTLLDASSDSLRFFVRASKGFYVRTLAQELAVALGTVGHLTALRRTASGAFTLAQAVPLEAVKLAPERAVASLIPIEVALNGLPAVTVSASDEVKVSHGMPLEIGAAPEGPLRVLGPAGQLLAIGEMQRGRLGYRRVLAANS